MNEDSLLARPEIGLWVVADGMGGLDAGDLASGAAVAALTAIDGAKSAADLLAQFEERIVGVNADLRALAKSRGAQAIGTTIAAILIYGAHYACVWCGDSRAYLWRDGALTQVSRDHSEVQDLSIAAFSSRVRPSGGRGETSSPGLSGWPRKRNSKSAMGPLWTGTGFSCAATG